MAKKNFILDTNVILHDYNCINSFEENDIYLPIVVLEELDKFKKGNEQINFNAREFIRELDLLSNGDVFKQGVSLGEGLGKLFIVVGKLNCPKTNEAFPNHIPDNYILATTEHIKLKLPEMQTILVSKDVNLRMKARALELQAEDYISDKVLNIDLFASQHGIIETEDSELIERIYSNESGVDIKELEFGMTLRPNDYFILKSNKNSVLSRYNPFTKKVQKVNKFKNFGIEPRNAEQTFALDILNDDNVKLVAITGKAGTGKTLLALAAALRQSSNYKQILLARPIVSLSNKDIGFLPGDAKDKVAPYMQPLFDNLNVIKNQFQSTASEGKKLDDYLKTGQLVIEALAFIRGRSLSDMFCIVDEAQNLTPHEIKTIITRAGENTKMVFTGDIQQIDHPYLDAESNGLAYMIDRMKDQPIFGHVNLVKGERSELSELASNLL